MFGERVRIAYRFQPRLEPSGPTINWASTHLGRLYPHQIQDAIRRADVRYFGKDADAGRAALLALLIKVQAAATGEPVLDERKS